MEPVTLGFVAALMMGLAFGAGPCNITCLPYIGPVFLHSGSNRLKTVFLFSLGRLTGYAMLGAVAGAAGQVTTDWLEQGSASAVLGGATLMTGVILLFRARKAPCSTTVMHKAETVVPIEVNAGNRRARYLSFGLFGMGLGMAFNPCLPLGTVLLGASVSGHLLAGLWLGIAFGIGAVLVPAVIFGVLVKHLASEIRSHLTNMERSLERSVGGLLIVLGVVTMAGWIQP